MSPCRRPAASILIILSLAAVSSRALAPLPAPGTSKGTPQAGNPAADSSAPRFLTAPLPRLPAGSALAKASAADRDRTRALDFLESIAPRFGARQGGLDFRVESQEAEEPGKARRGRRAHFRIRQLAGGLPVFGGEGRVVLREDAGTGEAVYLGSFRRLPDVLPSSEPVLTAAAALDTARADLRRAGALAAYDPELAGPAGPLETAPDLVLHPGGTDGEQTGVRPMTGGAAPRGFRPAWHLAVRANLLELWEYVVDARDGAILEKYPAHCTLGPALAKAPDLAGQERTFGTWQHTDLQYYLVDAGRPMFDPARFRFPDQTVGTIVTMDMASSHPNAPVYRHITSGSNAWADPTAVSAHHHARLAYEYFLAVHGRNSINGLGGAIRSFINVAGPDGGAMDNAYWNGNAMFYGNGKTLMSPLAGSLDVGGHELTHGVVGATAALRYRGESGAINESMADIFGAMIDREDWRIGEDVVKRTFFPTGAMRDMESPNQGLRRGAAGWQPAHMTEFETLPLTAEGDWGGVHANSGILNRAFVLFAGAVGKEKAESIYYRALTRYLTASSQFVDLRQAVLLASRDLHAEAEASAAADAFAEVGIGAPANPVAKPHVLPVHAGPQYVLLTRAGAGDGPTLHLADSVFGNPAPLSRTPLRSKPSVSDDGSTVLFVSGDGRIVRLAADPARPQETVLDTSPVWSRVAISKDGRRFAAVKAVPDTAIHVGRVDGGEIRRFPLYNPRGLGVRTAVFADALDWDHAGENVLYDVYNRIPGADGAVLEYWDVGLLRVWSAADDRFAAAAFQKPFGDLADGYSAGNPAFARNSPDVVVYEYFAPDGSSSLMARDIETRRSGRLGATGMVGHPGYDMRDAGVAYTTLSGADTAVAYLALLPDKLSPAGPPSVAARGFKWPVFLAKGARPAPPAGIPAQGIPHVTSMEAAWRPGRGLVLELDLPGASEARLAAYSASGRRLASAARRLAAGRQALAWAPDGGLPPGLVFVEVETGSARRRARVLIPE